MADISSQSSSSGPHVPYNLRVTSHSVVDGGSLASDNDYLNVSFQWDFDGPLADWDFEYRTDYWGEWTNIGNVQKKEIRAYKGRTYFEVRATKVVLPGTPKSPTASASMAIYHTWLPLGIPTGIICTSPSGIYDGSTYAAHDLPYSANFSWTVPDDGTGTWAKKTAKFLNPLPGFSAEFGNRVASRGNYLVVSGSQDTYVYFKEDGTWRKPWRLGSVAGEVAIAEDASYLVVGGAAGAVVYGRVLPGQEASSESSPSSSSSSSSIVTRSSSSASKSSSSIQTRSSSSIQTRSSSSSAWTRSSSSSVVTKSSSIMTYSSSSRSSLTSSSSVKTYSSSSISSPSSSSSVKTYSSSSISSPSSSSSVKTRSSSSSETSSSKSSSSETSSSNTESSSSVDLENAWDKGILLEGSDPSAFVAISPTASYVVANNKIYMRSSSGWGAAFSVSDYKPSSNVLSAVVLHSEYAAFLSSRTSGASGYSIRVSRRTADNVWDAPETVAEDTANYTPTYGEVGRGLALSGSTWLAFTTTIQISPSSYVSGVEIFERTDTNEWTSRMNVPVVLGGKARIKFLDASSCWLLHGNHQTLYTRSGSTWSQSLNYSNSIIDSACAEVSDDGIDLIEGSPADSQVEPNSGAFYVRQSALRYQTRTSSGGSWSDPSFTQVGSESYGLGDGYFGVRAWNGYVDGTESALEWTTVEHISSSSSVETRSSSSPSSSSSSVRTKSSSSSWVTKSSSMMTRSSSSSSSSLATKSSSSTSSVKTRSSSSSSSSVKTRSSSSSSSSVKTKSSSSVTVSYSSSSSSSQSSSSKSSSSRSSSSSLFGRLDAPTDLQVDSVDPLTREIIISWTWSTLDHWGNPVTPTAFIVERKIDPELFETLSYSVSPAGGPNYTYTDDLSEDAAAAVFALGRSLTYRVRAYWLV